MLNIERKISRKDFPAHNIPAIEWRGEVLRIRTIKKQSDHSRFTIISSKKLYKSKPIRNIFKRRVYSELRQSLHKFDTSPHGYFIIFPLIHMEKISFSSIKKDLEKYITLTFK
jgi:ribonuclease P protein component